ncbi:MAG: transcript cleavage factor [Chlamydiae bacterium GWA2_50_15]|nr:MAG: transcript cleavage factor [Chlamydiae bacterium GWA2_50_15]
MSYLKDFQTHLDNRNYPGLLSLWEEYCLGDTLDPAEAAEILRAVKESDMAQNFGRHVENILPLFRTLTDSNERYELLKLIFDLQATNSEELWQLALSEMETRFAQEPHYEEILRILGLKKREEFQGVFSHFELLNHIKRKGFVFHTGGWGVGEVIESSLLREELRVEFDYVPGKKDLSFQNAFKTLIPLPDDHFLALRFGSPDLLEKRAKDAPAEVIRLLLRDLGPKSAEEIKNELCELVIPEKEWTKWWQGARSKIKRDNLIETPPQIKLPFRLRKSEVTHEERLKKALESKPDANTLIQMLHSFFKDFPQALKSEAFRSNLEAKLSEVLSYEEITDAQELQLLFFLEDLSEEKTLPAIEEFVKRLPHLGDVLQEIILPGLKKRFLMEIRKGQSGWKDLFLSLFLTVSQHSIRDYLLSELLKEGAEKEVVAKLEELCALPTHFPEVFLWYFQKITGKPSTLPFADETGKIRFFESFLILLSHLEQISGSRDLIKKMYQILTKNRYGIVREIFKEAGIGSCREFLLLATKCHTLSNHDIKIFNSLAEVVHPSLAKSTEKGGDKSSVIWTTQAGFRKVQERIQEIATVETVQTAKEIEVARGHGDLRENAEYKAALEKRDRLQSELKQLSDQLNQARILSPDDISKEEVGIGSVVDCKNSKGESLSFTLLGPWDADPQHHILSFQSKLAQSMLGRKVNDRIQVLGQDVTIVGIRRYTDL